MTVPASKPPAHPAPASAADVPRDRTGRALAVVFFLILAVLAAALYTARLRHPGPDSGEYWSDSNIINAARGFDDVGFTTTWGLPRIQTGAPIDDTKALYLSYPPGPYWLSYGAWSAGKALGFDPVLSARLFAQTCGLASAVLFFAVCSRLAHSRAIGAFAAMFYVLSPAFLAYSAALHHMAYSPMLLFGALLSWLAFEDGRGRLRVLWLALAALLFAADCWTNLEHMFFFAAFIGVRTLFHFHWPVIAGAALVGPIPIPMMALRVLHNAQVLGGWDAAVEKFQSSATRRSGGGRLGIDLMDLIRAWAARLDLPNVAPAAREAWNREFVFPALHPWVLAAVGVAILSLLLHRRMRWRKPRVLALSLVDPGRATMPRHSPASEVPGPRLLFWSFSAPGTIACGFANALLLLAGGLTWFVVMTQHTQPHRFIVLLLMPGLSLALGTLAWWIIASARAVTGEYAGAMAGYVRVRAWIVAASMLGIFAANVRRADVLNQLAPLDPATRDRAESRLESNARVARLGAILGEAGVERVHMFDGSNVMPWRAASIALPFVYARVTPPESLSLDEALCIEAWDAVEFRACLDAAERFGLPDLVEPPGDRLYVFRGSGEGRDTVLNAVVLDARAQAEPGSAPARELGGDAPGGLTIRSIRWAPTLFGDEMALTLLVTGDLSQGQPEAVLNRFVFTLRARDAGCQVTHGDRDRLRWALRDETRALVVLTVPADGLDPAGWAELVVWDRRERTAVDLSVESSAQVVKPDNSRGLRWPLSPAPRVP